MIRFAGLTGILLAVAPAAAAGQADSAAPPAATAPAEDLNAMRVAVAAADLRQLVTDHDYAATMLGRLDRLAVAGGDADTMLRIDNMRLLALSTLRQGEEIAVTIDRMLAQRPTGSGLYLGPWIAAWSMEDHERAVAAAETASRNVAGVGWANLRLTFNRQSVGTELFRLQAAHQEALRARLAAALFRIGWPGGGDRETADGLRTILLDERMRAGDTAGAAGFAAGITTPANLLTMIVQSRYDAVLQPGADRVALLRASMEERERETAAALAVAPREMRIVLERAQHLRAMGRNAEALELLTPFTRDVAATAGQEELGIWLVNEAGFALMALGRADESIALMRRLTALPFANDPRLVGPAINLVEILGYAGRPAEALAYARRLEAESGALIADYGKLWLAATSTCALAELGRAAEAAPEMERLRAGSETNRGAATKAFLCLGDDDAAAALMIRRLQSDDPESAILALQDYPLSRGAAQTGPVFARLTALRERPDVRDALARVGRALPLPLARTRWGNF